MAARGARAVGLRRWSAPRRRSLGSARRRVLASGEGRLVLTPPRILLCLSRLTGAVLTANRVGRGCRAWAVGHRALVDEFEAGGTSRHAREGGRGVCARGVVRLDGPACRKLCDVRFFPSIQKFGQHGAPAHERPSPPPPGTGLAARSASVASHTALFAQPPARCPLSRSPRSRPRCSDCALAGLSHAVSTRGVEQPPHPSHRAPHATHRTPTCALARTARLPPSRSPRSHPVAQTVHPPLLTRCRHTRLPVTEPTRSHG
jgi:hypothetical protein